MENGKNDLFAFFGGLAMLVAGLYLFMSKVDVISSWGTFRVMHFDMASGVVVVPLIIGIIMVFAKPDSFLAKIICAIGVLIIIAAVIATTHIRLSTISLYEWVMYLVLIFGGAGLLARVLFRNPAPEKKKKEKKEK